MSVSLEEMAYNKIKVAISKGYITTGSKLKETSLAQSLKMSRATVKGAIKRLVYEGLAEYVPHKGTSVVDPSLEEIKESFQVRAQLEKMAVSLAAGKFSSRELKSLNDLVQKEREIFKVRELVQYYEVNNAIHLAIAGKSGNRILVHYIEELLQRTTIYLILFEPFYQLVEQYNNSPLEHQQIIEHLETGDSKAAGLAMETHLETVVAGMDVDRLLPQDNLTV
jgi:DNA-binding GntR family transcriptional regulator